MLSPEIKAFPEIEDPYARFELPNLDQETAIFENVYPLLQKLLSEEKKMGGILPPDSPYPGKDAKVEPFYKGKEDSEELGFWHIYIGDIVDARITTTPSPYDNKVHYRITVADENKKIRDANAEEREKIMQLLEYIQANDLPLTETVSVHVIEQNIGKIQQLLGKFSLTEALKRFKKVATHSSDQAADRATTPK